MPHTTTKGGFSQAHPARAATRCLAAVGAAWRRMATSLFVGYRPERHYMRGPGPKWHERNSSQPR
jgi:hypothetical protein